MTKVFWSILILFLIGNAMFVLPFHWSNEKISTSYFTNFKKDTDLLRAVFPDSSLTLHLNMAATYSDFYYKNDTTRATTGKKQLLMVNVSFLHNVDFGSLSFPFYKVTNFNGQVNFYSTIKISNQPWKDSTSLIGNININGRITVVGICTPLYVRKRVEEELAAILKREMTKIEVDINHSREPDSTAVPIQTAAPAAGTH